MGLFRRDRGSRLVVQAHRTLAYKAIGGARQRFADPAVEYVRVGGTLRQILGRTLDTTLPFGGGTLDDHAKTFLRAEKAKGIRKEDMGRMLEVFRKTPTKAYHYAILDAVLTLLVAERMAEEDHKMYETLGFDAEDVPPLRPTLGGRVAEIVTRAVARHAAGSVQLSGAAGRSRAAPPAPFRCKG